MIPKQIAQRKHLLVYAAPFFIIFIMLMLLAAQPQSIVYSSGFEGGTAETLAGWQVFDPYRVENGLTGTLYTDSDVAYSGERSLYYSTPSSYQECQIALAVFFAPDDKTETFKNPVAGLDDPRTWNYLPPISRDDLVINPMVSFQIKLDYKEKIRIDFTAFDLEGYAVGAGSAEYEIRGQDDGGWIFIELNLVQYLNTAVGDAGWELLRSIEIREYNVDPNLRSESVDLWMDDYVLEAAEETVRYKYSADGFTIIIGIIAIISLWKRHNKENLS